MSGSSWADYPKYVEPGQTIEWRTRGEFWYLKQGQNLKIQVHDQTCTGAQKGDYGGYTHAPFSRLVVTNRTDYRQLVNLVIGFGEFDRKEVTGTIYGVTGILDAEGNTLSDDRITEAVNLAITDTGGFTWTKNQILVDAVHGEDLTQSGGYYDPVKKRIIAFYSKTSSDRRLAEFDPDTFSILTETGDLKDGAASLFSVDPYRQYASFGGATTNELLIGARGELESNMTLLELVNNTGVDATNIAAFYDARDDVTYLVGYNLAADPDDYLFCTINRAGEVTDLQLLDNQSTLVGSPKGLMRTSADGDEFQLGTTGGAAVVNFKTKTIVTGTPYAFLGWGSIYDWNENFYMEWPKVGGPTSARKRALEEKDYLGYGYVSLGNCLPLEIFNREFISKISADVTLTQEGERLVKVEGELIKAILELYAAKVGGVVPTDYLDYIFGIKGGGINVFSGDESFKRVGISDNFTTLSPTGLSLTFSKRLLA